MFSELIRRNSKRNRQENTLYFVTMILTVAAFYIILALDHQDVMIFLKEMERDAVNKLLMLIPIIPLSAEPGRKDKIPSHKYNKSKIPNVLINAMIWLSVRDDINIPIARYTHPNRKNTAMEL